MRTNIELDDDLVSTAMAAARVTTKKAAVEAGLRLLIQLQGQRKAYEAMEGIGWIGDLAGSREGR